MATTAISGTHCRVTLDLDAGTNLPRAAQLALVVFAIGAMVMISAGIAASRASETARPPGPITGASTVTIPALRAAWPSPPAHPAPAPEIGPIASVPTSATLDSMASLTGSAIAGSTHARH